MAVDNHELELWLSGGSGNTDPAASLGGARSTAETTGALTVSGGTDIAGVSILAGFARRAGVTGTIQTDITGDVVSMTNYGDGSNTTELTVSGGPSGTEVGYITMVNISDSERRVAALVNVDYDVTDLLDTTDFTLEVVPNNLFSLFPDADYAGGETYYRCFYVLNNGGSALGASLDLNLGYDDTTMTVAWGLDPAGIDGTATTIANEHTAPAGVSFQTTPLAFPALAAAEFQAVWVRIVMAAAFTPPAQFAQFSLKFTDDTTEVYWASMGLEFEPGPEEDLEDSIGFSDTEGEASTPLMVASLVYDDDLTDSVVTSDLVEGDIAHPLPAESITFSEVIEASLIHDDDLTDSVTTSDLADGDVVHPLIPDEITFDDEADAVLVGNNDLTDAFALADAIGEPLRIMTEDFTETITFTEEIATTLIMAVDIEDDVAFLDVLDAQGEILDGWVINLETGAASRYEWLRFSSLTRYEGGYYGATPDGIYELDGDDDDGADIDTFILTQQAATVDLRETRTTRAYLGMKFTGEMVLKTITDEGVNLYSVQSVATPAVMQRHRVKLGGGVRTVYWQFALQNVEGGDFEADTVWILPIVLSRRFR